MSKRDQAFEDWAKDNPLERGTTWRQAQHDAWDAAVAQATQTERERCLDAIRIVMQHSQTGDYQTGFLKACTEIASRIRGTNDEQ
jgi:hypothetical protein